LLTSREGRAELALLLRKSHRQRNPVFSHRPRLDLLQKSVLEKFFATSRSAEIGTSASGAPAALPARKPIQSPSSLRRSSLTTTSQPASLRNAFAEASDPPPWKLEIVASDIRATPSLVRPRGYLLTNSRWNPWITPPASAISKSSDQIFRQAATERIVQFDFHNLKTEFPPAPQRHYPLPQRYDLFRRSRAEAPDRKVSGTA